MTQLQRIHHVAYVVKDHEATRHFYEDVLGLPLIASWAEVGEFRAVPGRKAEFCHTFFGLGDGSALAFFAFSDEELYEANRNRNGIARIAISVSPEKQAQIRSDLEKAGYTPGFIDHGYCQSLYATDPDQMTVEFTSDPADIADIAAWQAASAHETLSRWLDGDHIPNNDLRNR